MEVSPDLVLQWGTDVTVLRQMPENYSKRQILDVSFPSLKEGTRKCFLESLLGERRSRTWVLLEGTLRGLRCKLSWGVDSTCRT